GDYQLVLDYVSLPTAGRPEMLFHSDKGAEFTSGGTPVSIGSALSSSFVIEKPRASVAIQALRPANATRILTQYAGAEKFGPYASIKTASNVTNESFVTLLRPVV